MKTLEDLDQLIDGNNDYSARALPWSLVLTSGMAAGYMELADQFSAGARVNKAEALAFRRKATAYRTMASPLVLRFAQNVDKLNQLPAGSISLAFPLPRGNASASALLSHVSAGTPLSPTDLENAQTIAIQHSVLMTACVAAEPRTTPREPRRSWVTRPPLRRGQPLPARWPRCWKARHRFTPGTSWTTPKNWRSCGSGPRACGIPARRCW